MRLELHYDTLELMVPFHHFLAGTLHTCPPKLHENSLQVISPLHGARRNKMDKGM